MAERDDLNQLYEKFSDTGKGYRSLNKTLANFATSLANPLMENLRYIHLRRAITDRLELITLLHAIKVSREQGLPVGTFWQYATRPQIEKAMSVSQTNDVEAMVIGLVSIEPPGFKGGIVGLAEIASKKRQSEADERRQRVLDEYWADTKLPSPNIPFNIPLPPGVTFIDTLAKLAEEGRIMNNCVLDYIRSAVHGDVYFFHVERDGEHATAKLDRATGCFVFEGKHRKPNTATNWKWYEGRGELTPSSRRENPALSFLRR